MSKSVCFAFRHKQIGSLSGAQGRVIALAVMLVMVSRGGVAIGRTWTMADGRHTLEANFVSLEKGEVSLQTTSDEIRKVPLQELSELDRDVATRLGGAAAKDVTVDVEGVGLNPTKALEDAFLRAVIQAVGTRVKSKTVVEGDVLTEDKVLVFSDGFVSGYDRVSGRQEAGLSYERIKAVVRRRDISEKSSPEEGSRDASHLYAEAFTKIQRHRIAMAILQDAIDGFGAGLLDVKLLGRDATEVIPGDLEHVRVRCDLKAEVNVERYRLLYEDMVSALSAVARSSGRFTTPTRSLPAADPAVARLVSQLERQFLRPSADNRVDYGTLYSLGKTSSNVKFPSEEEAAKREAGSTLFYLCVPPPSGEGATVSAKTCAWRWFEIDGHPRLPAQRIATVVRYSDAAGQTVFEDSITFSGRTPGLSASGHGQKLRTVVVSPFFLYHGSRGYLVPDIPHAREVTIQKTLRMPLDVLAKVRDEQVLVTGEVLERPADFPEDVAVPAAAVAGGRGAGVERFAVGGGTIEVRMTVSNGAVSLLIHGKGYRGNSRAVAEWIATNEFKGLAERAVRSVARTGGSWSGEFGPFQTADDGTISVEMVMRRK
jgi:hypothetical protein